MVKVLLIAWGCSCALSDCRYRRIPNSLTIGAALIAVVYLLIEGHSILGASTLSALTAGVGAILVFAPFLWSGWLGAGDIKMMSAIGFIGGTNTLAVTFVLSSFLTIPVVACLWLSAIAKNRQSTLSSLKLPQGLFLALGLILTLFGLTTE